jgi:transcriptional regulator with XRE-family HTH domain
MKNQPRVERGARARHARESALLSQSEVAELIGCSRQLVGSIEAGGAMSVDQLVVYSVHGRTSTDAIVFGTPQAAGPEDKYVAEQFARLDPWLRAKLWPLYQVFVRQGVHCGDKSPAARP